MFTAANQVDWAVWGLVAVFALSPIALLFIVWPRQRRGRIGPSSDSVASALEQLSANRPPKPPPPAGNAHAAAVSEPAFRA
jgi:hypothetical protein